MGLVLFTILVVINFVVVTKGATRVSEVTARFTLDAMPGKQMAIDADLNAGLISQQEALDRRERVTRESDFYGAMDGASKFVRGDAVAGILILLINIIGGFAIGTLQHGLDASQAAQNYVLLTIGDGWSLKFLRSALDRHRNHCDSHLGEQDMSAEVSRQLTENPRSFMWVRGSSESWGWFPECPI